MSLPNTHYGADAIAELLRKKCRLFFAGIGGISMCSLAWIAHLRGHEVAGYDRTPSDVTRALARDGINVYYDEDAAHVSGIDALVYTVAMPETNAEYAAAKAAGIPCISRADFLGYIMTSYRRRVGVSGMHGKSTTTSMLERIYTEAGRDPVVSCGATMKDVGTPYRIGRGSDFIFEACEYMDSFLDFYPTTAIILNIEMDHVDYFHSMRQITDSFGKFIAKTEPDGIAVLNIADENVAEAAKNYKGRAVTFGVGRPDADYNAANVTFDRARARFDLLQHGVAVAHIEMNVPGEHIVPDATAAAAAAIENGIAPADVARALALFGGAERRLENCGKTARGADVYSDYAHHPTEIKATLRTAGDMGYRHIYCVFQPHTYSRTWGLLDDFAAALASAKLETLSLAEIYPARETNVWGVTSAELARRTEALGQKTFHFTSFEQIISYLTGIADDGDMVLVMGAGDIGTIVKNLLA